MDELGKLSNTFEFYYALNQLREGNDKHARRLYYEGKYTEGYPFFERYKSLLETQDGNGMESLLSPYNEPTSNDSDKKHSFIVDSPGLAEGEIPFAYTPLEDYDHLINKLIEMFPDFRMRLKKNPRNKRIVYAADVNSIFDIAWFTLSRLVADDAPPEDIDYDADFNTPSGTILSCLSCGSFFIRKHNRQLYCMNSDCQAARKRKNRRDCDARKKMNATIKNNQKQLNNGSVPSHDH